MRRTPARQSKIRSFTLIEVLVVVAIIGILASLTAFMFTSAQVRGRDAKRKTDLDTIKSALERYQTDYRYYPVFDSSNMKELGIARIAMPAKWQLEKAVHNTSADQGCEASTNAKNFLTPNYLPTLPEDPIYKLKFSNVIKCPFDTYSASKYPVMNGQYFYFSPTGIDVKAKNYRILARMENPKNAVDTSGWSSILFNPFLVNYKDSYGDELSPGQIKDTFEQWNYLVTNSKND